MTGDAVSNEGRAAGARGDRYVVHSVERALALIELVAEAGDGGITLTALARGIGASKSTALSTARTLVAHGALRAVDPGPRYKLGIAFIRLGDLAAHQNPIGEICVPELRAISEETGLTSRIAVAEDGYPVFIERVDGPGSVRFHAPLGQREPPHATGAGKAILATLSADQVRSICAAAGMSRHTARTIVDVEVLLQELEETRRRGFAIDDEEDAEGVFCVGAAFFDHTGRCAGAVSVTGIKGDLPTWYVGETGKMLRVRADAISAMLGGPSYARVEAQAAAPPWTGPSAAPRSDRMVAR